MIILIRIFTIVMMMRFGIWSQSTTTISNSDNYIDVDNDLVGNVDNHDGRDIQDINDDDDDIYYDAVFVGV